ncbi:hypothetical protein C8Q78DRAFT_232463 [Trametes maxima]|nr:hypothetical protein C8Q78DRAFT_232463 [Trametes maxima]
MLLIRCLLSQRPIDHLGRFPISPHLSFFIAVNRGLRLELKTCSRVPLHGPASPGRVECVNTGAPDPASTVFF